MWHYEFTRRIRECRLYVGPVPLQPARTERHVLDLTFGVNGLERAIYTEVAPSCTKAEQVVCTSISRGWRNTPAMRSWSWSASPARSVLHLVRLDVTRLIA